jgi:hypothetical protein
MIAGIVAEISMTAPQYRFCPPDHGTVLQNVQIVVNYLQAHPEKWHENFAPLAHLALKQDFPCR